MKPALAHVALLAAALLGAFTARANEEFFDRLDAALTTSALDGAFRARVSGTLDLEIYRLPTPAPALLDTARSTFFNPRLTAFLDAHLGPHAYVFAQARADRGFDPHDGSTHVRLDEYALRFAPWRDVRASVQVGKFATVVGNWVARHGSWDNPFISAPLPYERLTGIWDNEPPRSLNQLLLWSHLRPGLAPAVLATDKQLRVPLIWGPAYGTGASVSAALGRFTLAAEVKNSALSSRPKAWDDDGLAWRHPTLSTRVAWSPNAMWHLGLSASTGAFLLAEARPFLAPGAGFGDYRERTLAADLTFAWHHWQIWAEVFQTRFALPRLGDAATTAAYAELKYRFTPRFSAALRLNRQTFGTMMDPSRGPTHWDRNTTRIDFAPALRLTPHVQVKLEAGVQHETGLATAHSLAAQLTVRF
jgi:hypothetical protein